jgi:hypothetical protein
MNGPDLDALYAADDGQPIRSWIETEEDRDVESLASADETGEITDPRLRRAPVALEHPARLGRVELRGRLGGHGDWLTPEGSVVSQVLHIRAVLRQLPHLAPGPSESVAGLALLLLQSRHP